ncbi:Nn.00g069080.m01.CDS01 [Neocucurbitaria sp. VM-36]
MSTFAPPTRRGDFLYSSLLYADAGNSNHHPRASAAELAALLRPEAPNLYTNRHQPTFSLPAKDPPWHFYSAQLIHYGLPVTKDKNTAKVRLLDALNQFKLEVPAWVGKVEGDLRKEWEAENRRVRKAAGLSLGSKGVRGVKSEDANGRGGRSSQSAVGSGVNVSVNVTLSTGLLMAEQPGVRKATHTPEKPSPTKRKRASSDLGEISESQKLLKRAQKPKSEPKPQKQVAIKKESTPKKQVKREPISSPARARVKKEPRSPPSSSSYTLSPYLKPDTYPNNELQTPRPVLLSGTYHTHISCAPLLPDNNDNPISTLTLYRDSSQRSSTWWATLSSGPYNFLIRMNPGPSISTPCLLNWRLRNVEDNALTFGRKCTGEMTFFGDQTFRGVLDQVPGVGAVEIEGERVGGPGVEGGLQEEWDGFVREAYGR